MFPGGRNPADTVTVTVDSFYNRVNVVAGGRKMKQIEEVVAQLDAAPQTTDKGARKTLLRRYLSGRAVRHRL